MANTPFDGAHALIFGGAKGIGKAVAHEWARRGASITIADFDEAAARQTAEEIAAKGAAATAVAANVCDTDSVIEAVRAAEAAFGEVDILMNNVGAMLNGHPEDIPFEEWLRITDLNYFGTLRAVQIVMPKMLARKAGHIVNTASFAGFYPYAASRVPYAATKAAIIALSENLALYLEPQGVRVSCLIPGPVMTGIMSAMTSWTEDCPMRGPGSEFTMMMPGEVATKLADGMRDGKILIPSDEVVWETLKRWAESPDEFIRTKIRDFENGDPGIPGISAELRAKMAALAP